LTAAAGDALATNELVAPNVLVHLTCDGLDIGRYTVQTVTSDTGIVFKEKVSTTCTAGSTMVITVITSFFNVPRDMRHVLFPGDRLLTGHDAEVDQVQWDGTLGQVLMKWHDSSNTNTGSITNFASYENGNTEKTECSDRGVCDTSTGECLCFLGYTGNACSSQNSLAA
jgi:hypothetical protein